MSNIGSKNNSLGKKYELVIANGSEEDMLKYVDNKKLNIYNKVIISIPTNSETGEDEIAAASIWMTDSNGKLYQLTRPSSILNNLIQTTNELKTTVNNLQKAINKQNETGEQSEEPTGEEPTGDEPTGEEPTGEEITGEDIVFVEQPTAESIIEQLGDNPIKPVDPQTLNMTSLTRQTSMYLAFPISWLVFDENEILIKPKITNSLRFELGYEIIDTIEVNGIEYGVFEVTFNKDTYIIEF